MLEMRPNRYGINSFVSTSNRQSLCYSGPGAPNLKSIVNKLVKKICRHFLRREFGGIKNAILASRANAYNFVLKNNPVINTHCPCCGCSNASFIAESNWRTVTYQATCPICGSSSRHRGITAFLPQLLSTIPNGRLLIFAPEMILMRHLREYPRIREIVTTDLHRSDVDHPNEDIHNLSFPNGEFIMIMCNHVLEHTGDDEKALAECSRILAKGGVALFTVPGAFPNQITWEFDKVDNNGHYRHYGMDIIEKMKKAFTMVKCMDMSSVSPPQWMVRSHDMAFVCYA